MFCQAIIKETTKVAYARLNWLQPDNWEFPHMSFVTQVQLQTL